MVQKKLNRSAQKRAAILDAAKEAFKEQGVNATSMDHLAARAQVSKRTVYNHFCSKEALVLQLVTELWKQATQDIQIDHAANTSLHDQLSALLTAELALLSSLEYMDMARVALGHYFYKPEALQRELNAFDKTDSALFRWLSNAREQKLLSIDSPEQAIEQLHSLIKGEAFWPVIFQQIPPLDEAQQHALAERTTSLFLSYYEIC